MLLSVPYHWLKYTCVLTQEQNWISSAYMALSATKETGKWGQILTVTDFFFEKV